MDRVRFVLVVLILFSVATILRMVFTRRQLMARLAGLSARKLRPTGSVFVFRSGTVPENTAPDPGCDTAADGNLPKMGDVSIS